MFCLGGFCPGGFWKGGFCPGGLCPGGFCPGGFCPRTIKVGNCVRPQGFEGSKLPVAGNLTKNFAWVAGFDQFRKFSPVLPRAGGGRW